MTVHHPHIRPTPPARQTSNDDARWEGVVHKTELLDNTYFFAVKTTGKVKTLITVFIRA